MIGFMGTFVPLTISLVAAATIAQGLGACVYLAIEAATPISGAFTSVTSSDAVDDLLAGTQISAQAATDLKSMFAQVPTPAVVYIATYDTGTAETPDDALAVMEAAQPGLDPMVGLIAAESRLDADLVSVATWMSSSVWRSWRYKAHLQSDDAGLLTSGKPSAFVTLEIPGVTLHYAADTVPQAAAAAGMYSAFPLVSGPAGLHFLLRGIALPSVTDSQRVFAKANDVVLLQRVGAGVSSNTLIMDQTAQYSGDGFSASYTLSYSLIRYTDALQAMVLGEIQASPPRVIFANASGVGKVYGALAPTAEALFSAGHFTPGTIAGEPAPGGYAVTVTTSGSTIPASVVELLGQEATSIPLSLTGQVV